MRRPGQMSRSGCPSEELSHCSLHLSEEQKLTAPAYEPFRAGVKMDPDDNAVPTLGELVHVTPTYETVIHDPIHDATHTETSRTTLAAGALGRLQERTAVAQQDGTQRGTVRFPSVQRTVRLTPLRYAIVDAATGGATPMETSSLTEAQSTMTNTATSPTAYAVLPVYEVAQ
jgi:hypothetical protein